MMADFRGGSVLNYQEEKLHCIVTLNLKRLIAAIKREFLTLVHCGTAELIRGFQ